MDPEEIVRRLVATGKWSREQVLLGLRAGFQCEYCDRHLLESPDSYKLWQQDHIVPLRSGGKDEFENKVLACALCNVHFKNRWDPRVRVSAAGTRMDLLKACREYIKERREQTARELAEYKGIVGV